MKCPKCVDEPGMTKIHGLTEDFWPACPHCRGKGEIQEGDWWMGNHLGSLTVSMLHNGEWRVLGNYHSYLVDCFNPLYRMDEVK